MGFWGTLVLCRSGVALEEFELISERDGGLLSDHDLGRGWHLGAYEGEYLLDERAELMAELNEATGAPSMVGYVADSDCVFLEAVGPGHARWHGWLAREAAAATAEDWKDNPFHDALEPATAVEQASRWAAAAGLQANRAELARLFTLEQSEDPDGGWQPAELLLPELCDALGMTSPSADQQAADQQA